MHELSFGEFHRALPLYAHASHSRALIMAAFEGNHRARLFVDDAQRPTAALLALSCGFVYPAGNPADEALKGEMRELVPAQLLDGPYLFISPLSDAWADAGAALFADLGVMRISRCVFELGPDWRERHASRQIHLPDGLEMRPYDAATAQTIPGMVDFWGSIERFMAHGFGMGVFDGDVLVSHCHTILVGDGCAEAGVETQEAYRRRGLATLACRAFIGEALARGLRPTWSCWHNNDASVALAESVGYVRLPDAPLLFGQVKEG